MLCTNILQTVSDSNNAVALPKDGHRGKCCRHLVLTPDAALLFIYSSAHYLTLVVISFCVSNEDNGFYTMVGLLRKK